MFENAQKIKANIDLIRNGELVNHIGYAFVENQEIVGAVYGSIPMPVSDFSRWRIQQISVKSNGEWLCWSA